MQPIFNSCIVLIFCLLFMTCVPNQEAYRPHTFKNETGERLLYRLMQPLKKEAEELYPLWVFLHGAGERGDDNMSQLMHVAPVLKKDSIRKAYPSYVAFPQCPEDEAWANMDWDKENDVITLGDPIGKNNRLVMGMIEELLKTYPIDPNRVYIGGLSLGGFGTLDLLSRYPDRFAAGVAICGGTDLNGVKSIAKTPLWIYHGAKDEVVPASLSRKLYMALKGEEAEAYYTEFPNVDHESWNQALEDRRLLPWLYSKQKP